MKLKELFILTKFNLLNSLNWLVVALIVSGMFISCRNFHYDKTKISQVKNILLLQVNYHSASLDKKNVVRYPYDEFICESFLDGFVSNFNANTNGFKIQSSLLNEVPSAILRQKTSLSSNVNETNSVNPSPQYSKQISYLRDESQFVDGIGVLGIIDHQKIPIDQMRQILSNNQCSSYLVIDFTSSIWKQDFSGQLQVFSASGKNIFTYRLKNKNSKYIIYDPHSPYVIKENEFFRQKLDRNSSHETEIAMIYCDLGKIVAQSLNDVTFKMDRHLQKQIKRSSKK